MHMRPLSDDRREALRDEVRRFAAGIDQSHEDGARAAREMAAAGIYRRVAPAAFGGAAERVEPLSLCVVREEVARASGLYDAVLALQALGSYPITLAGDDAQKRRFLPGATAGSEIAAFAVTENDAGSDVASIATTARRDGDAYVLDGEKVFISNAGIATFYTVFARTGPGEGAKGLSAIVVPADAKGLTIEPMELISPHPIGRLRFAGVRVPQSHRLGAEGDGFRICMGTLDLLRPTVGAAACGFAARALAEATARVQTRRQFGKPLAENQAVQFDLAEMATELDAARLLVYRAAWLTENAAAGARVTRESSMAKLYATEAAQRVVDRAVQLHGGLGVMKGVPVERLYRDVRAMRIYEGASEVHKLIIARELLRGA